MERPQRLALIVANDEYEDAGLQRLEAPAHDAAALAEILGDPGVGMFEVSVLYNRSTQEIRSAVEDFFIDKRSDDLLLLHFSCHGMKNADGELFLALKDTRPDRLASTGLPADFVNRMMAGSRAQRIALFLDCCYGGAFPRGMLVRAAGEAQIKDAFAQQEHVGGGRGRVVVTASNAMQYSFEAGELSEETVRPSVFTGALVDALSTGEADKDADGWIGMNELFSFVTEKVREVSPNQQPQMWTFGAQGDIVVARSRVRRVKPIPLEPALAEAMANPLPAARYGLVDLFRERLDSADLGVAMAAHRALTSMLGDDSKRLADAASAALLGADLGIDPPSLDLVVDESSTATGVLTLSGPPIAMAVTARVDVAWLSVEYDDPRLRLRVNGPLPTGTSVGTLTLKSPIGEREVLVRATVPDIAPRKLLDQLELEASSAAMEGQWSAAVGALEAIAALQPTDDVAQRLSEAKRRLERTTTDHGRPEKYLVEETSTLPPDDGTRAQGELDHAATVDTNDAGPPRQRGVKAPLASVVGVLVVLLIVVGVYVTTRATEPGAKSREPTGSPSASDGTTATTASSPSRVATPTPPPRVLVGIYLGVEPKRAAALLKRAFPDLEGTNGVIESCDDLQKVAGYYELSCRSFDDVLVDFNYYPKKENFDIWHDIESYGGDISSWGPDCCSGHWGTRMLNKVRDDLYSLSFFYDGKLFSIGILADSPRAGNKLLNRLELLAPPFLPSAI